MLDSSSNFAGQWNFSQLIAVVHVKKMKRRHQSDYNSHANLGEYMHMHVRDKHNLDTDARLMHSSRYEHYTQGSINGRGGTNQPESGEAVSVFGYFVPFYHKMVFRRCGQGHSFQCEQSLGKSNVS